MKNIFRILIALLFTAAAVACSDEKENVVLELDVNYANLAGTWKLSTWSDNSTDTDTYFYITLDRKEKTFVINQNIDSSENRKLTGNYAVYTDEALGAIIRGNYDYGTGDWNHRYIITSLTTDQMVWVAKDDATDISVYKRSALPADLTATVAE